MSGKANSKIRSMDMDRVEAFQDRVLQQQYVLMYIDALFLKLFRPGGGIDTEAVYVALVSPRARSVRWFPASVPQCVVDRPDSPRSPSQDCGHWVRLVSAPSVYPEKRSG